MASQQRKFKNPKGTRDLYPDDLLRQRYITEAWRRVSIRHGFDEIAGPTFEHLDLYTVKSGEGIVSELFSFKREGGSDDYALRPEFTPTLARLYAAKAASLPSPTKWFTAGPYFRAERPQRGRLREFLQWNCDVIGGGSDADRCEFDGDTIAVLQALVRDLGFKADEVETRLSDRQLLEDMLLRHGVHRVEVEGVIALLDARAKLDVHVLREQASRFHLDLAGFDEDLDVTTASFRSALDPMVWWKTHERREDVLGGLHPPVQPDRKVDGRTRERSVRDLFRRLIHRNAHEGTWVDLTIARGLAYYTGTVFELIADGERAVAGGGRYDNLIELFGGPPTPAVGFGMGDVVLSLLLEDKNLMPEGADLREALSQPGASLRPEAFVIADEDKQDLVEPLLANLRRGVERDGHDAARPWASDRYSSSEGGVRPLHARRSYRAKRKKQMQDASGQFALFTVTINEPGKVELRPMDARDDLTPHDVPGLPDDMADFSVDPQSPVYVGRAIASLLAR